MQHKNKILESYKEKSEQYWATRQEQNCLKVFQSAVKNSSAYRDFLIKKHKINPGSIKNYLEFSELPFIDKASYFKQYPLFETLNKSAAEHPDLVFTATSGSTGLPTYFSRQEGLDQQYSVLAEFFLSNAPKKKTLLLDCLSMGIWVGGLITYQAYRYAALRDWPVSILTIGINKKEIFHALKNLAPQFDYVIIMGYPPFTKDLIDEAKAEKIDLTKFKLRLMFCAESFTENFRDYVVKEGNLINPLFDTLNLYGSAELGAMAFETPGAIFIRRLALKHPAIYKKLFAQNRLPTLAQYNPDFICFEEQNGEILMTADSAAPFVRYKIGDNGGVYKLSEIVKIFSEDGVDLVKEAKKSKVPLLKLPFVYVYERSDFSTTLYGLQVYPQTIKRALENKKLTSQVTGKFTMETSYDKQHNQYLQVHLELKKDFKPNRKLNGECEYLIVKQLLEENSEYRELCRMLPKKLTLPKLIFWPYNHEVHFASGVKQRWAIKK